MKNFTKAIAFGIAFNIGSAIVENAIDVAAIALQRCLVDKAKAGDERAKKVCHIVGLKVREQVTDKHVGFIY